MVRRIAAEAGATPAQVVLAWGLARGVAVIPKSSSAARAAENLGALRVQLTPQQVADISALNTHTVSGDGRTGGHARPPCPRHPHALHGLQRFNDPGVFCEAAFGTFCPIFD